jgi:hypothetical protein
MALSTTTTANDILNRVAAEVGIAPSPDPYASTDPIFVQMTYLLNTAGEELMYAHQWEFLTQEHQIITAVDDTGVYPLPTDFGYMINQTGWERAENVPLGGPLSAQDWTYLKGRDLASSTLYASFRISDGNFNIYPEPPPVGLDINFEYNSINWVSDGQVTPTFKSQVNSGSDVPLYDKTLITRYVKVKYLESSGFDTTKAQADFNQIFSFITGFDQAAGILNAGRGGRAFPYLSVLNAPDTNFGLP